jgi:16S rRNA (uracil1498-N3)-methyltransferase
VNLVLLEADEIVGDRVILRDSDRRVHHLRTVLGVAVGSTVRAGVVGGQVGTAEVIEDRDGALTLAMTLRDPAPEPLPVELVLAVPRPKALSRVIEAASSFGVSAIQLTNAWRVDKSYLDSPRLDPGTLAMAARLGAEQGATTHVPAIEVHRRLMPLLDARWPAPGTELPANRAARIEQRLIAHPGAPPIERVAADGPFVLAIGPEGGWIEREVDTFLERGFSPVSLGTAILRVETAVAAALAQLVLLGRLRAR